MSISRIGFIDFMGLQNSILFLDLIEGRHSVSQGVVYNREGYSGYSDIYIDIYTSGA